MSIGIIAQKLTALLHIHEDYVKLSNQKTDILIEGDITALQKLLVNERKLTNKIEIIEAERLEAVDQWFMAKGLNEADQTITNLLHLLTNGPDKQLLAQTTNKLSETLEKLKEQEALNQSLIRQSMQFVQFSIDVISPTIKNMNYGKTAKTQQTKRSVFDSKA